MFETFGDEMVNMLNGMYAFAIWDTVDRSLFMARDRLGEKPLYYANFGSEFVFASELKSIRAGLERNLSVSSSALDDYLAFGYIPDPHSIYEQVHKLPPAHAMRWSNGESRIWRYWSLSDSEHELTEESSIERFDELLQDSMRLRLRSDVPVGAFLSGGIDSTVIVYSATQGYDHNLSTYTIGFHDDSHDESSDAAFTASFLGTQHNERIVDQVSLELLPTLVRQYDEPFADPSALPTYIVTREASRDLKVCLSGDGGDELFGGYPQYRPPLLERTLSRLPLGIRMLLLKVPLSVMPEHVRGYGLLQRQMSSGARQYQQVIGVFSGDERHQLHRGGSAGSSSEPVRLLDEYFSAQRDDISNRQFADLHTWLPGDILTKVDRSSMAHSLEVRVPFLDHRIVEFAHALPSSMKIRNGIQKWILRKYLEPRVPAEILNRRKQGFGVPLCSWFRGEHKGFAADRLISGESRLHDLFESKALQSLFDNHQKGQRDFSDRIWTLICLEEWLRAFA